MNIRQIKAAFISACMMTSSLPFIQLTANAEDYTTFKYYGVTYRIYSDHVEAVDGKNTSGDISLPVQLSDNYITIIGEGAFKGAAITSIKMPKTVDISNEAFRGCKQLVSVSLPDTLKTIGANAFAECTALKEIVIPVSAVSVGENAFADDTSLVSVTFLNSSCVIDDRSFTISNGKSSDGKIGTFKGKIIGYTGSTAEQYAKKYGYNFTSLGSDPSTTVTTTTKPTTTTTTTTTKKVTSSTTTTSKTTTTTTTSKTTTTTSKTTTASTTPQLTTTSYVSAVQGEPILRITHTEVNVSDVRKGKTQRVTVSVEGADGLYCNTGIYVYFDKRLAVRGYASAGEAISELISDQAVGDTADFIFLSTSGDADKGKDGNMWYIDFDLPENAEVGDTYLLNIGDSKYGRSQPLFTNFKSDSTGEAMNSRIFSVPAQGSITVVDDPPYTLGDINDDGIINAVDASLILTQYAKLSVDNELPFVGRRFLASDVNKDGILSAVDASIVLSYYAYSSATGTMSFTEYLATR